MTSPTITPADREKALRKQPSAEGPTMGTFSPYDAGFNDGLDANEARVVELRAALAAAATTEAALKAFKSYVHRRLDEAGIPTHPNGAHSKQGCRVGDRLDIALAAEARATALEGEVQSLLAGGQRDAKSIADWKAHATAAEAALRSAQRRVYALVNNNFGPAYAEQIAGAVLANRSARRER